MSDSHDCTKGALQPMCKNKESTRRSAPFRCIFKSDDEVRQILDALKSQRIHKPVEKDLDGFDSDASICSVASNSSATQSNVLMESKKSDESGLANQSTAHTNQPTVSFFLDDEDDIVKPSITKKRTYFSTGPLCITPSRKRKKPRLHHPVPSGHRSSSKTSQPKAKQHIMPVSNTENNSVDKNPRALQRDNRSSNLTRRNACDSSTKGSSSSQPTCDRTAAPDKNDASAVSSIESSSMQSHAFGLDRSTTSSNAVLSNTLYGYRHAVGDSDIIRAVGQAARTRVPINWANLDRTLNQTYGYCYNRYNLVLKQYANYDVAIARAVLCAQANNQPVCWAELDAKYPLGRAEARWNLVLRAQCDKNGNTVNGQLRPELYHKFKTHPNAPCPRSTQGATQGFHNGVVQAAPSITVAPSAVVRHSAASLNILPTTVSVPSMSTSMPALPASSANNNSNVSHSYASSIHTLPFTLREDKLIMSSVKYVMKNKFSLDSSWTAIGKVMNRPGESLKARWRQLQAEQLERRQNPQVIDLTGDTSSVRGATCSHVYGPTSGYTSSTTCNNVGVANSSYVHGTTSSNSSATTVPMLPHTTTPRNHTSVPAPAGFHAGSYNNNSSSNLNVGYPAGTNLHQHNGMQYTNSQHTNCAYAHTYNNGPSHTQYHNNPGAYNANPIINLNNNSTSTISTNYLLTPLPLPAMQPAKLPIIKHTNVEAATKAGTSEYFPAPNFTLQPQPSTVPLSSCSIPSASNNILDLLKKPYLVSNTDALHEQPTAINGMVLDSIDTMSRYQASASSNYQNMSSNIYPVNLRSNSDFSEIGNTVIESNTALPIPINVRSEAFSATESTHHSTFIEKDTVSLNTTALGKIHTNSILCAENYSSATERKSTALRSTSLSSFGTGNIDSTEPVTIHVSSSDALPVLTKTVQATSPTATSTNNINSNTTTVITPTNTRESSTNSSTTIADNQPLQPALLTAAGNINTPIDTATSIPTKTDTPTTLIPNCTTSSTTTATCTSTTVISECRTSSTNSAAGTLIAECTSLPTTTTSLHTSNNNHFTTIQDKRIIDVVSAALKLGVSMHKAWEVLRRELRVDITSVQKRWLELFKNPRIPSSSKPSADDIANSALAKVLLAEASSSSALTLSNPELTSTATSGDDTNIVSLSDASVDSVVVGDVPFSDIKLALSPLEPDTRGHSTEYPQQKGLSLAFVDSESDNYW